MVEKAYGIITLLRWLSALFILATVLTLFVYSPYYSKSLLWLLEHISAVQVDPVAAKSQKSGQLSLENQLEPGSAEWVARRAYLYEVNHALQSGDVEQFVDLQIRYQQLLETIQLNKDNDETKTDNSPLNKTLTLSGDDTQDLNDSLSFYHHLIYDDSEPLFQQYREFLKRDENLIHIDPDLDVQKQLSISSEPLIFRRPADQPHAIVILGGGLTEGKRKGEIVVNAYTEKRLEQAVEIYQQNVLPILLSGVEAPYMQKWLENHQVKAQFLENRSMNTCENTRFSALLLQKQGGAPTVFLITDAYHMPRSQRLFANNGIATIPVVADLPQALTDWQPNRQNLMHSRRATYEMLASLRDLWFGESNCREIP